MARAFRSPGGSASIAEQNPVRLSLGYLKRAKVRKTSEISG